MPTPFTAQEISQKYDRFARWYDWVEGVPDLLGVQKLRRRLINLGVSSLALATGAYIVAPVALWLASRTSDSSFGLLHVIPLPFSAEFVLGFLFMDLTFYYWHRANHAFCDRRVS